MRNVFTLRLTSTQAQALRDILGSINPKQFVTQNELELSQELYDEVICDTYCYLNDYVHKLNTKGE